VLLKIRHAPVKVRRPNSEQFKGEDKFTGTVTFSVVGSADRQEVRLALGTDSEKTAIRRVEKIKTACAVGPTCPLWAELDDSLPLRTFQFFATLAGYVSPSQQTSSSKPTWTNLAEIFELEMTRLIANKKRGTTREEGIMSESTRDRYRQTIRHFTAFLKNGNIPLDEITATTIELFKVDRVKAIEKLKQGRGGTSVALDVAVLHRLFAFAIKKGLIVQNPIHLENESKPGKNPKNGARPFTADELSKLRVHAQFKDGNEKKPLKDSDYPMFLLLRWTGLRGSDAIALQWRNVHFDRGANGEIEVLTQKRTKTAIIPLSSELRDTLEHAQRRNAPDDFVLLNPDTNQPFSSRHRLYDRVMALGDRAGVKRATPHCFRDTFACDMLARGTSIYDVAKMLADTVDTVEKHYASFVQAARDAAQSRMDNGIGIEERAKLARNRGKKVLGFPSSA
jgi:integrase